MFLVFGAATSLPTKMEHVIVLIVGVNLISAELGLDARCPAAAERLRRVVIETASRQAVSSILSAGRDGISLMLPNRAVRLHSGWLENIGKVHRRGREPSRRMFSTESWHRHPLLRRTSPLAEVRKGA